MTSVRTVTCDRCGKVQAEDQSGKPDVLGEVDGPWRGLQFNSTDRRPSKDGNFRMRFVTWDLCDQCADIIEAMIREEAKPSHESGL